MFKDKLFKITRTVIISIDYKSKIKICSHRLSDGIIYYFKRKNQLREGRKRSIVALAFSKRHRFVLLPQFWVGILSEKAFQFFIFGENFCLIEKDCIFVGHIFLFSAVRILLGIYQSIIHPPLHMIKFSFMTFGQR